MQTGMRAEGDEENRKTRLQGQEATESKVAERTKEEEDSVQRAGSC